tara:strand:+ start:28736 stop:29650 length:915 start_codon:yes stop_codon:yes gene_type:complete
MIQNISKAVFLILFISNTLFAQESNIQTYTPSKLLKKGQWDIKFFNSIYTQTEQTGEGSNSRDIPRESYFTNTNEVYTGVSKNARINIGFIFQIRSNVFGDANALDVFKFNDDANSRSGLTTIAPSIRVQPFPSIANLSFTSSLYIAVFEDKVDAPYLDKRSLFWETKFFYDKTFGANKWQIFTEADLGFNFGENRKDADPQTENISERFANNSVFLPISAFLSYFPSSKSTVFVNAQQAFLIGYDNPNSSDQNFSQNATSFGFGGKYQLTNTLNIEVSYGKIARGYSYQGLGHTYSIGLRTIL